MTPEQLSAGRRLWDAWAKHGGCTGWRTTYPYAGEVPMYQAWRIWRDEHAHELLDAAERCAVLEAERDASVSRSEYRYQSLCKQTADYDELKKAARALLDHLSNSGEGRYSLMLHDKKKVLEELL